MRLPRAKLVSRSPGVDHGRRQIFKIANVASREGGVVGKRNSGDHRVAQIAWPAAALPRGHEVRRLRRGRNIERRDAVLHSLQESFECLYQERPSPSGSHDLQTEPNLKNGYCRCPY
jgi:hypothetical protein